MENPGCFGEAFMFGYFVEVGELSDIHGNSPPIYIDILHTNYSINSFYLSKGEE